MTVEASPRPARSRSRSNYLAPAALALVLVAVIAAVTSARIHAGDSGPTVSRTDPIARAGARYWTVRPGNTFRQIAARTGLSVAQLQAFNPQVDPMNIPAGRRLDLTPRPAASSRP